MGVSRMSPSTRRSASMPANRSVQVQVQPRVDLDRGDLGAGPQQRGGQDADARADLQDRPLRPCPRRLDDGLEDRAIHEMVLAQLLVGPQAMTPQIAFDLLRAQVDRVQLRERIGSTGRRRRGVGHADTVVVPVTGSVPRCPASRACTTDAPPGPGRPVRPPRTGGSRRRRSSPRCRCTGPVGAPPAARRPSAARPRSGHAARRWRRHHRP